MPNSIHYFGIRHHGPGSAKRLVSALTSIQPVMILIEGPSDCSDLLPLLHHAQMRPPISLLAFNNDQPSCCIHYPFAEFSPEYQASRWASENGVSQAFIDLPVALRLEQMAQELSKESEQCAKQESEISNQELTEHVLDNKGNYELTSDPIGLLAQLQGYEDGESWWNDLIEQNSDSDEALFEQVDSAMSALREQLSEKNATTLEKQREAFMRLEIAKAAKSCDGPIAVVCGAWHVPALRENVSDKSDRDTLKSLPKKLAASKLKSTWIPWTSPRLATSSGYGAGVSAPMWYQHLWHYRDSSKVMEAWLTHVARALREQGYPISTASVIEAMRLSHALSQIRNRPAPGFEELREAVVACLCFGEPLLWRQLEHSLLLGNLVGHIPDEVPLAPLMEDLQKQQARLKLKPEALPKELSLDLRSQAGIDKSTLLHRLNLLDVSWGRLNDAGRSRGTFRERWQIAWQPEHAVQLVENLVYGTTIEQASTNRISEAMLQEQHLPRLAECIMSCLEAQLQQAADVGLQRFNKRAAHTSDCLELLGSIPTLVSINRYGTARELSLGHIAELIDRLANQSIVAMPYACRNLNDEEAHHFCNILSASHEAIQLHQLDQELLQHWWQCLHSIVNSTKSSLQVAGLCARLLYQANELDPHQLSVYFQRMVSPATSTANAAKFFEGFFENAVQRLLYDSMLINAVESWLVSLDSDEFIEHLPLLRRLFADLDSMERKRMIDTILRGFDHGGAGYQLNTEFIPAWQQQLSRVEKIMQGDVSWLNPTENK